MAPLALTLLGGFQARLGSGSTLTLPTRKAQALLAYLALRPGQAHPRDKLAALLWGDTQEARARDSLRHTLAALRKALPATTLVTGGATVALSPATVEVDVARFEEWVGTGTPEALERAVSLYRGDLLEGLAVSEPGFEEWLLAERERLRELALEALAKLLAHQMKTEATERAIQTAVRLLALDPLQEVVHRALMRLYARQGRRAAALRQYQVCLGILERELGAEPEAETRRIYQEILHGRAAEPLTPEVTAARPPRRAVELLRRAGAQAALRSAYREATASFEGALRALAHLPESPETMALAIDLRLDLRNSLLPLRENPRIHTCLREAEAIAQRLSDSKRLGRVYAYMTRLFWALGEHREAIISGERALAVAGAEGDFGLQVVTNFYLGVAYHAVGDFERAVAVLGWVVDSLGSHRVRERFGLPYLPAVFARKWLGWCLVEQGDFHEGIARYREALQIAESVQEPWDVMVANLGLGVAHVIHGDFAKAIAHLERSHTLRREHEISVFEGMITSFLGYAYLRNGQTAQGLQLLEAAAELPPKRQSVHHARMLTHLGEGYLVAGRVADAEAVGRLGFIHARRRGERGYETWALRLLGEVASQRDPFTVEEATGHYRQALALADGLGMRPLVAHCHLGLGKLYRQIGKSEQAHAELTTAADLYRAMDMTFWLRRAEAGLAGTDP